MHIAAAAERLRFGRVVGVAHFGFLTLRARPFHHLPQRHRRPVRAHLPFGEGERVRRDAQVLGGNRRQRPTHGVRRVTRRVAAHVRLAGSGRRAAVRRQVGIRKQHMHPLGGQPQFLGGHLRQHHAQPLAHVRRRDTHFRRAVREDFHFRRRAVRCAAAQARILVRAGEAPTVSLVAFSPAPQEVFRIALVHVARHQPERIQQADAFTQHLPRDGGRADAQRIVAAEIHRIDAQFLRQNVHRLFDGKSGLRDAETAKRPRRRVVGVHHVTVHLGVGHGVRAGGVRRGAGHHFVRKAGIRPAVTVKLGLRSGQRAVALGAHLHTDDGGVPLGVEKQRLLSRVAHLDGATGRLCQQRGVNLSGDVFFAAETAADQRAAHAHLLFRQAQRPRNLPPILVGDLRADVNGQLGVLVVVTGGHAD